jgi:GxxExxY protein
VRTEEDLNGLTGRVIGAAMAVHSALGPGLLESAYAACVQHELQTSGVAFRAQVPLPLVYKRVQLDIGYRIDLLVEDCLVVELKAVEALLPIHEAQLLSYLRLTGCRLGLLINFHVAQLRNGIRRLVNGL